MAGAAAAAAAGALPMAMPPAIVPLSAVRAVHGTCELGPNIDRFIVCHGITDMADFEFIKPTETESVV